jgi:hypothetical protein
MSKLFADISASLHADFLYREEKYALRVNFLILIEQTSEFSSGVSVISYFDVSFLL